FIRFAGYGCRGGADAASVADRPRPDLWFFVANHRQNALSGRPARHLAALSHADAVFVLSADFTL
ncbi:hypothetical protein, partial [Burkholderia cenocepacia]|uniref:hypothetical protein n=1 Tax=Burkholderia cenocepacia TaxID=95486 RepID=UPI0022372911